jgi:hypothetical protein
VASDPDSGGRTPHLGVAERRFKIFRAAKTKTHVPAFDERRMNRIFGLRSPGSR